MGYIGCHLNDYYSYQLMEEVIKQIDNNDTGDKNKLDKLLTLARKNLIHITKKINHLKDNMTGLLKISNILRKKGFKVLDHYKILDHYKDRETLEVEVKFRSKKGLPYKGLPSDVRIVWNFDSILEWVSKKIPKENIETRYLAQGELSIFENNFRRVYLIDNKSTKYPPRFDKKRMNGHGPRLVVWLKFSLEPLVKKALEVIKEKRLKKYTFVLVNHLGEHFGGYIGISAWDYWEKVHNKKIKISI